MGAGPVSCCRDAGAAAWDRSHVGRCCLWGPSALGGEGIPSVQNLTTSGIYCWVVPLVQALTKPSCSGCSTAVPELKVTPGLPSSTCGPGLKGPSLSHTFISTPVLARPLDLCPNPDIGPARRATQTEWCSQVQPRTQVIRQFHRDEAGPRSSTGP